METMRVPGCAWTRIAESRRGTDGFPFLEVQVSVDQGATWTPLATREGLAVSTYPTQPPEASAIIHITEPELHRA